MNTAVISCGPSWTRYAGGYDLVIGVNWIACEVACDWVCVHDAAMLGGEDAPGMTPALWSPRPPVDGGKLGAGSRRFRGEPRWFLSWHALSELDGLYSRPDVLADLATMYVMTWPTTLATRIPYSGLSALVLLTILGIDRADLFGFDMHSTSDGRGVDAPGNRSDARWIVERRLFRETVDKSGLQLNIH